MLFSTAYKVRVRARNQPSIRALMQLRVIYITGKLLTPEQAVQHYLALMSCAVLPSIFLPVAMGETTLLRLTGSS